jgi:bacterioferritin
MEFAMDEIDQKNVIAVLNQILEQELAGVVRYTHYSFMVHGYGRIPIVSWLRSQAAESLTHAQQAGELITTLGGHPSLSIGPLLDMHRESIGDILKDSLETEAEALKLYYRLLEIVRDRSVLVEEYARTMIAAEEMHSAEVRKMLKPPGDATPQ